MSVSLLDVNVLLALAWPTHVHHLAAHRWFAENYGTWWATCLLTQLGFVRLSMQPAVVKIPILIGDVMEALAQMTAHSAHRFWPLEGGLADIRDEIGYFCPTPRKGLIGNVENHRAIAVRTAAAIAAMRTFIYVILRVQKVIMI